MSAGMWGGLIGIVLAIVLIGGLFYWLKRKTSG